MGHFLFPMRCNCRSSLSFSQAHIFHFQYWVFFLPHTGRRHPFTRASVSVSDSWDSWRYKELIPKTPSEHLVLFFIDTWQNAKFVCLCSWFCTMSFFLSPIGAMLCFKNWHDYNWEYQEHFHDKEMFQLQNIWENLSDGDLNCNEIKAQNKSWKLQTLVQSQQKHGFSFRGEIPVKYIAQWDLPSSHHSFNDSMIIHGYMLWKVLCKVVE